MQNKLDALIKALVAVGLLIVMIMIFIITSNTAVEVSSELSQQAEQSILETVQDAGLN